MVLWHLLYVNIYMLYPIDAPLYERIVVKGHWSRLERWCITLKGTCTALAVGTSIPSYGTYKKSPLMYAAFWFPFADITHALNIVNTRTVINDSSSRTVSLTYLGLVANRLCAGQNTLVRLFTSLRHSTNKCSSCLITAHSRRVR